MQPADGPQHGKLEKEVRKVDAVRLAPAQEDVLSQNVGV